MAFGEGKKEADGVPGIGWDVQSSATVSERRQESWVPEVPAFTVGQMAHVMEAS